MLFWVTSYKMWAQIIKDKEPAILEVHYIKTSVADTLKKQSDSDPMTLRIGKTSAMFYPTKMMWADSLLQTDYALYEKLHREMNPLGQSEYKPLGGLEREYLFRNINDGETMVYRVIAGEHYSYTEPTEMPAWQILSETKEVMGYSCQLASCDFRGRRWYADSKKHYVYKAVGLYTKNLQPVGIRLYISDKPYRLKSRQKFLQKMYKEYILGDFAFKMSALHGNGTQSVPSKAQYDFEERDYPHK